MPIFGWQASPSPLEAAIKKSIDPNNRPGVNIQPLRKIIEAYPATDPYEGEALGKLGFEQWRAEDLQTAVVTLAKAAKLLPKTSRDFERAEEFRSSILSQLHRHAEAAAVSSEQMSSLVPGSFRYDMARSKRHEQLVAQALLTKTPADIERARQDFLDYISYLQAHNTNNQNDFSTLLAYQTEAKLLVDCNQKPDAIELLEGLLKSHPKHPWAAKIAFGLVLIKTNQTIDTIRSEEISWIPGRYPCDDASGLGVLFEIAHVLRRDGRPKEAIPLLKRVIDFDKRNARGLSVDLLQPRDVAVWRDNPVNAAKLLLSCYEDVKDRSGIIEAAKDGLNRFPNSDLARESAEQLRLFGEAVPNSDAKQDQSGGLMLAYIGAAIMIIGGAAIYKSRQLRP